ncbi:Flagellar motor protein [Sphingomonas antarctica]|uniref:flagellar motor protein MotB n=1 Tax=Sphingomonas antarctica TaxID=2040274 RepID=UPI0039E9C5C7
MKANANKPRPIIVKKIIVDGHGGHHGGAWKVAYADFVTAMMAFFLLMWLLGATNEKQRKALADYFAPTLVASKQDAAGSTSFFGGDSITSVDKYPNRAGQTGTRAMTLPMDAKGGPKEGGGRDQDQRRFSALQRGVMDQLRRNPSLRKIAANVHFTETRDGLRIDLVDDAEFAMFNMGTDQLTAPAAGLLKTVGEGIRDLPNGLTIRGHTDATPWSRDPSMNNWRLSTARSEATRQMLAMQQVAPYRFVRIEGVADREPYDNKDRYSPNNRRISITLTWSDAQPGPTT